MARQKPSISKHRLFPNHSSATSSSPGPPTSRVDGNTPGGSEQHSDRNSVAVRVSGRREDNSSVGRARLPAAVREMSPRSFPEHTAGRVRIPLLVLASQISARRFLSGINQCINYLARSM